MRDPLAEPSDLIRSVSRALRVLESVGRAPRGLTVKQIARRCELTVATTYHLVRTLAYEGYVIRREDGTYIVGLEIADRYRELVSAFRGPPAVGEALRRAAVDTGYSHYLGRFVGGRIAVTACGRGRPVAVHGRHGARLRRGRARHRAGQGAARHADPRPAGPLSAGLRHAAVHPGDADHAGGARGRPGRRRAARHAAGDGPVPAGRWPAPRSSWSPTATWNAGWCWPARCRPPRC